MINVSLPLSLWRTGSKVLQSLVHYDVTLAWGNNYRCWVDKTNCHHLPCSKKYQLIFGVSDSIIIRLLEEIDTHPGTYTF